MKILIYIQSTEDKINPISLESLAAIQDVKEKIDSEIFAVTFSDNIANQLTKYQLDEILYVNSENLREYNPLYFVDAFAKLNFQYSPDLFVFGHTYETRDWVPRLGARIDVPFLSDCIGMNFENGVSFVRSLYQNKININLTVNSNKFIVSFQSGAYKIKSIKEGESAVKSISMDFSEVPNSIINEERFKESDGGVDLSSADFIVSIGRGIGKEENIPMAKELSKLIGAQLASSRPVVDSGWLDHSLQIGSSGQIVSPKLYFALGISGAIQHVVGMKGSRCILAINKDANAPIFELSDYGVVGDIMEIIPKLNSAIKDLDE